MTFSSDDVKAKVKDLVKNELLSHRTEGEPWVDYVESHFAATIEAYSRK